MATQPSQPTTARASSSNQAQRHAQRDALIVLGVALALGSLAVYRLVTQPDWQIGVVLGLDLISIVAALVAYAQFRAGHLVRGGWILLAGMFITIPGVSLFTEGTGLALALVLILLTVEVGRATLPGKHLTVAVIAATILAAGTQLSDILGVSGRSSVAAANAVLPYLLIGLMLVLAVLTLRQFPSYSLRTKLILVCLAVSLVPLLVLGLLFTETTRQNTIGNVNQTLSSAAQKTASSLDNFIQNNLNEARVSAQNVAFPLLLQHADRQTSEYTAAESNANIVLRALKRRDPVFLDSIAVLDRAGNNVLDTNRLYMGTNEAQNDYFAGPVSDGMPYVSAVTVMPDTDRAYLTFSAPIRDAAGQVVGVLRFRYDAAILHEQIFNTNELAGAQSSATLLDEGNLILADGRRPDNDFKILGEPSVEQINLMQDQQRLPDRPIEEQVVRSPTYERGLAGVAQQPAFAAQVAGDSETRLVAVESMATRPWRVAFARAQSEFLNPLTQQIRTMVLGGFLMVAQIAGIAVLAAQAIARPVVALTATAQQVSQGDLTARAPIMSQDEIGTLAVAFNSMTEQLGGMVTTLEDRVQARTEQLRASAEVGRAATSILDPDQLLKQIVELISKRFGFYYTAVFVSDEENRQAVLHAATGEAGQILLERGHRLPLNESSMVGGAIITGRPKIALDVGQGAVRFANPLLPYTRSEIALPLRVGDRSLGALDVQSEQAGAFDESNMAVLQTMADQIAVALFNAETFQRSERQTNVMALLNHLSRELALASSLETVATAVERTVAEMMGQQLISLAQTTDNPQLVSQRHFTGDATRPVSAPILTPATNSMIAQCLEQGNTIYTPDLSEVADQYHDLAAVYQMGIRSILTLPLLVGQRTLGTLNISSKQVNAYTPAQITQLEQVASQVAITIQNLNLAEQTQQTLAELDAANRRLIGQAWEQYTRTTSLESAEWRGGQWIVSDQRTPQPETSRVVVPASQALSLPIKVRGTTIGEFNITAADARQIWDTEDMTFAQALVDQVGQVLETARLLDETERVAQREKAVADAADKIHRSADVEGVLQSAVTELQRITGRRGISVQLGFGRAARASDRAPNGGTGGDR
jgi:GAF domain-containing protein/HAMP domain-containing protein